MSPVEVSMVAHLLTSPVEKHTERDLLRVAGGGDEASEAIYRLQGAGLICQSRWTWFVTRRGMMEYEQRRS
jgi:hypothetical protein